ncbi:MULTISPECIES: hypothetical protein [Paenibacillaceae]|uniref:Uncharacterized protein n=1 Tax=Paenibacillus thailandensis TaxID=393250 RepID=A0ABW5QQW2_9BACL|nr:hypothetical protein [Cohnella massiliensis]
MSTKFSDETRSLKVKVDKGNRLVFVWMTENQKDSEEYAVLKKVAKSKKFKIVTFISGIEDMKSGLEKLILDNALSQQSVEPTWLAEVQ